MKLFFKHPGGQCELENVQPYDTVSLIKRRLSELDYEMKMKRYGESRSGVQNLTKNL